MYHEQIAHANVRAASRVLRVRLLPPHADASSWLELVQSLTFASGTFQVPNIDGELDEKTGSALQSGSQTDETFLLLNRSQYC